MIIAHLTEPAGGGSFDVIKNLALWQKRDGLDVVILHGYRDKNQPDITTLLDAGVKCISLNELHQKINVNNDIKAYIEIHKILKVVRPDILHAHSAKAGALARIMNNFYGNRCKVFYTPHGYAFLKKDIPTRTAKLYGYFEKLLSLGGGTILACSKSEFDYATTLNKNGKVILIENAIPLSKNYDRYYPLNNSIQVCTSARICAPKNPSMFLEIFGHFADKKVDFKWIGDGDLRSLFAHVESTHSNFKVTGWLHREQLERELATADIFIMTSLWEGMPLALIEAQCMGIPAIVFDVPGCKDIVINDVTGYICESKDQFINKLELLTHRPELRKKLGNNAKTIARERFSMERMHREVLDAYTGNGHNF